MSYKFGVISYFHRFLFNDELNTVKIKPTIGIVFCTVLFTSFSCSQNYNNKKEYNLKVGDEFEIYYTSNSCCGRCWNLEEIDNIELIGKRTIEKNDNPGGNSTYAKVFRATMTGINTLKNHTYVMSDSCDLFSKNTNRYLIHISK